MGKTKNQNGLLAEHNKALESKKNHLMDDVLEISFDATLVGDGSRSAEDLFDKIFNDFVEGTSGSDTNTSAPATAKKTGSRKKSTKKSGSDFYKAMVDIAITDDETAEFRLLLEEKNYTLIHTKLHENPPKTVKILFILLNDRISIALRGTRSDKIDDFVQHAFMRLIETVPKPSGWSGKGSLEAWLVRVAKNAFIEKERNKEFSFSDYERYDGESDYTSGFEERIANTESDFVWAKNGTENGRDSIEESINFRMAYAGIVDELSDEELSVLKLLMDEYKPNDISSLLHYPPTRVKAIIERIQSVFTNRLEGISHDDIEDEDY